MKRRKRDAEVDRQLLAEGGELHPDIEITFSEEEDEVEDNESSEEGEEEE